MPEHPETLRDLVALSARLVADYCRGKRGWCNGTELSNQLKVHLGGFDPHDFGVERLIDVVDEGVKDGVLVRRRGVKHLDIATPDTEDLISPKVLPAARRLSHLTQIRKNVWDGFMRFHDDEHLFMDRETHEVRHFYGPVGTEMVQEALQDTRLIPISTVPEAVQREWISDFRNREDVAGYDQDIDEIMASPRWFSELPRWLDRHDPDVAKRYKAYKSQRTIAYIKHWCQRHGLPPDAVDERPAPPQSASLTSTAAGRSLGVRSSRIEFDAAAASPEELRKLVLAALADLPLDDLLKIPIPAGVLLLKLR